MNGHAWKAFAVVVIVLLVGMTVWDRGQERERAAQASKIAEERIAAEIGICERVKADRVDSARAQTAMALLLEELLVGDGRQERIARAMAHAFKQTHESANQMRLRLFRCEPLIREGKLQRDHDALSEAQGNL